MLLTQLDMLTLDMFATQTRDLYHIATDRKVGYIEFAVRQIYRFCEAKISTKRTFRRETLRKEVVSLRLL